MSISDIFNVLDQIEMLVFGDRLYYINNHLHFVLCIYSIKSAWYVGNILFDLIINIVKSTDALSYFYPFKSNLSYHRPGIYHLLIVIYHIYHINKNKNVLLSLLFFFIIIIIIFFIIIIIFFFLFLKTYNSKLRG